jgi:hypothetical protein
VRRTPTALAAVGVWAHHCHASTSGHASTGRVKGVEQMNLSAPTQVVFIISLIIAVLALIGYFVNIPYVTQYQFWFAIVAYVVLAAGCLMKGA